MSTAQWIKEAEEQAKKYSDAIKTDNQYLLDQLMASKNNTLTELQKQQDNALYNLNTNQSTINKTAEDNAKQSNINRMLALRSNEQAMNRAGLGTQGIVGSQVNSINNSYGNNLTSILNEKSNALRDLEKEKTNTNLTYDTNRLNLENEYGTNYANTQKSINDSALNQYNNVYQNYLAMKQQEYENEQARLAQEEAKRQWEAEYALAQYSARRSGGGGDNTNPQFTGTTIKTDYWNGEINPDTKYGTFNTTDKNGVKYQPDNVGGNKLTSVGKVSKYLGTGNTGSTGANVDNQKMWTTNGRYYIWDGSQNKYIDVTSKIK